MLSNTVPGWVSPEFGGGSSDYFSAFYFDAEGIAHNKWFDYFNSDAPLEPVCNCVKAPCDCDGVGNSPSADNPTTLPSQQRVLSELIGLLQVGDYGFKAAPNIVRVQPSQQTNGVNMDIKKISIYVVIALVAFFAYKKFLA